MDIFCKIINGEIPSLTVYEDDIVKVFLDVNPDVNGHLLVVPKKHILDIYDMDDETLSYIFKIAKIMTFYQKFLVYYSLSRTYYECNKKSKLLQDLIRNPE